MNERIEKLAEQAHSYACEYTQQPDYNPHNPYNQSMYKQRYDSKFAELLIRECAEIGERYADGNYEVSRQILARFGMNEDEE